MVEAMLQGFFHLMTPINLVIMIVGVSFGVFVGIMPGLGAVTCMILMLPIVAKMAPEVGLPLMFYMNAPALTAGAVTAILLNIPGEQQNLAVMIDGYPMTKKGQGVRAIGAAFTGSVMGGVSSVFIALLVIPLVMVIVKFCGSAETWALILLAVAFISGLGGGSITKGVISGCIGFLLAFVGFQANTGVARFTFGSGYLYNTLPIVAVAMGMFALPILIEIGATGGIVEKGQELPKGRMLYEQLLEGARDVFRHFWLWFRSLILGFIVGIAPAIGGTGGAFMAYGQAAKTSKHPELFGTGTIEGVIAPQSCANACAAGDILVTLAFGIPGSSSMIYLLAAFIMWGITPGPTLIRERPDILFEMMWITVISNIVAVIICVALIRYLIKVAYLKADILIPFIFMLVLLGAYNFSQQILDFVTIVVLGTVGYCIRRFGYSPAALVLAFVLGRNFERFFFVSFTAYHGWGFLLKPIVLGLLVLVVYIAFGSQLKFGLATLFRRMGARGGG